MRFFCSLVRLVTTRIGEAIDAAFEAIDWDDE